MFCPQVFARAEEKDDHTLNHFAHEKCIDCDENLIRIGGRLYVLHDTVTCVKREMKSEIEIARVEIKSEPLIYDDYRYANESRATNATQSYQQTSNAHSTPNISYYTPQTKPRMRRRNSDTANRTACNICGKQMHTNSMQRHLRNAHSSLALNFGDFKCPICGMQFAKDQHRREHIRRKHPEPNAAGTSHNAEPNKKKRVNDTSDDDDDGIYLGNDHSNRRRTNVDKQCECDLCGRVFHVNSLKRHKIVKHSAPGTLVCTMCCKILNSAEELAQHTLICISKRNNQSSRTIGKYQCSVCGVVASRQYSLRKHMQLKHSSNGDRLELPNKTDKLPGTRWDFVCDQCGAVLKNDMALQRHRIVMHSDLNTIICSICMVTFDSPQHLAEHKLECIQKRSSY